MAIRMLISMLPHPTTGNRILVAHRMLVQRRTPVQCHKATLGLKLACKIDPVSLQHTVHLSASPSLVSGVPA